jgi:hypothetical protein
MPAVRVEIRLIGAYLNSHGGRLEIEIVDKL